MELTKHPVRFAVRPMFVDLLPICYCFPHVSFQEQAIRPNVHIMMMKKRIRHDLSRPGSLFLTTDERKVWSTVNPIWLAWVKDIPGHFWQESMRNTAHAR